MNLQEQISNRSIWAGRIVSTLVVLFLIFDGVTKIMLIQPVRDASVQLGLPVSLTFHIGIIVLVFTLIYAIPRTAILGAMLLTGFLGGAVAIQLRIGNPLFSMSLFPVYFAVFVWGGLFLRDARLRALLLD